MASKKLVVEFYYDVFSPFSYFAFESLCRHKQPWNMDLVLKPCLISAIFRESNNKAPALLPKRALYYMKDLDRLSDYHGVKVKLPEEFLQWVSTKSSVVPQRFLTALQMHAPEYVETASRWFWKRLFNDGQEVMSEECVPAVGKKAGIPQDIIQKCLAAIKSDAVKEQLKKNTNEALEDGAFGLPSFVAHINGNRELFFGQDRVSLLAHMAGKPYLGAASAPKN